MKQENILSYERVGDIKSDTTLIFLHGSTMTKGGMLPLAKRFKDYNCIVFDLTAHGQSDGKEPQAVSGFMEDLEYSIKQLQLQKIISERIILLGYSMGGAITCEAAIRNNIGLSGMVLLSSGGDLNHYTPLIDDLKSMPVDKFKTEDILYALFGSNTPKNDMEQIVELFSSTKTADETGYGDLMASNGYDNLSACKGIKIPALIVHGSEDKIVLPMAGIETWKVIENSQLLVVPFKGHGLIYEDTDVVEDKINSFIKTCIN